MLGMFASQHKFFAVPFVIFAISSETHAKQSRSVNLCFYGHIDTRRNLVSLSF